MSPAAGLPIRVLVIEDEEDLAERLRSGAVEAVEAEVAVTGADGEAAAALAEGEFDLVVLDIRDDAELFRAISREHPGVPVTVLGGDGDPGVINELLAAARREDLFGTDREGPMVSFYPRERVDEAIEGIAATLRATAEVAALAIEQEPPLELSTSEVRAIQIFARRTGAAAAKVTPLGGGLSGAKTVVVDAAEASGMRTAHVVGKLSGVGTIPGGVDGYENAIPYLPAGLGAALAGIVSAGAGDTGAVFYRLADDYRRTFFECLAEAPADAAAAAKRLHERFRDRYLDDPHERHTLLEIRQSIVSDAELDEAVAPLPDVDRLHEVEVEISRGIQHRDLHGLNVLVSDSNEPLLIDYDNYAPANCALDPITLELSTIFHRDEGAQAARGAWPTAEQARAWSDLDAYLEGCPYPEAIRACRAWAEEAAASPQELSATLLSASTRQFWFENTDKEIATAMVEAGAAGLEEG